jgi:hypothetical protein
MFPIMPNYETMFKWKREKKQVKKMSDRWRQPQTETDAQT